MAKIVRKANAKKLVPAKGRGLNSPKAGFKPGKEMKCGGKKK